MYTASGDSKVDEELWSVVVETTVLLVIRVDVEYGDTGSLKKRGESKARYDEEKEVVWRSGCNGTCMHCSTLPRVVIIHVCT